MTGLTPFLPLAWKPVVLASLACCAVQGCAIAVWSGVDPVPVAEVDTRGASLDRLRALKPGDRAASASDILGEPADRRPSCVPGQATWRYPIRAWNDMAETRDLVPAVLLRVTFDRSGTLASWGFFDAAGGHPLAVRETAEDAARWFRALAEAPPPIPPRIELDGALIRGQTTSLDVERILGQWQPDFHCGSGGPAPVVSKTSSDAGSTWEWYVDRPSPLFVPPRYLVVSVDDAGALIGWHLEQTYPGGRE